MISAGSGVAQAPAFGPTKYGSSDDPEKLQALGDVAFFDGKKHKFVQVHTSCTNDVIAANEVLYHTSTENVVTNTLAQAVTNSVNNYAGVAPALTASVPESTSSITYYMWMQVDGRATVKTNGDDDIVAGDYIIASGNGTCDSALVGATDVARYIGMAAADDVNASDTVAVNLRGS